MTTKIKTISRINAAFTTPAFDSSFVNTDSAAVIAPKKTRRKKLLTTTDPLISKSIAMRTSFYDQLQEAADKTQKAAPGEGKLSVFMRMIALEYFERN